MEKNSNPIISSLKGVGVSARPPHYADLLSGVPQVSWLEILIDNFLYENSLPEYHLDQLAERYPLAFHGVELSIGSTDPLDWEYLKKIKSYIKKYQPLLYSDHLCFVSHQKEYLHDLVPLPYTEEAIKHVVQRVKEVQDYLELPLMIENVSSYLVYKDSVIGEGNFMSEIIRESQCKTLLDINNCYVTQQNHSQSAMDYIDSIPKESIGYIHLAGHTDTGDFLLDTHSKPVCDEVWNLYEKVIKNFGDIPTTIEWDDDIPVFGVLLEEVHKANGIRDKVL